MLAVAETASRIGRIRDAVRSWMQEGRVRVIQRELHPMAELPEEWKIGDDGSPAPNWVAALYRSPHWTLSCAVRFTRQARQRLKLYRVTRDQAAAIAASGALADPDARGNPRRTGAVDARTIVVVIALDNPDLIITLYERTV